MGHPVEEPRGLSPVHEHARVADQPGPDTGLGQGEEPVRVVPVPVAEHDPLGPAEIDPGQAGIVQDNGRRPGIEKNHGIRLHINGEPVLSVVFPVQKPHSGLVLAQDGHSNRLHGLPPFGCLRAARGCGRATPPSYRRIRLMNRRVRSSLGEEKNESAPPFSTIRPRSMKTISSATSRAKAISWVTTTMVIPSRARSIITSSTSWIISGSRAEVGLVKEHDAGLHGQGPGNGHALLLSARQLAGVLARTGQDSHPVEQPAGPLLGLLPARLQHVNGGQGDVLKGGHMRVELEVLEDHADPGAQPLDVGPGPLHGLAVHEDLPFLKSLQPVDAPEQGALARAAGAADDDLPAAPDGLGDAAEGLNVLPVPQAHVSDLDHDEGSSPILFSSRRLARVPREQRIK